MMLLRRWSLWTSILDVSGDDVNVVQCSIGEGNNQSVLANTAIPDSTLKKKSHSLACHFVREGVAQDEWRTACVNTHLNPADLLVKPLPSGEKRSSFIGVILHWLLGKQLLIDE